MKNPFEDSAYQSHIENDEVMEQLITLLNSCIERESELFKFDYKDHFELIKSFKMEYFTKMNSHYIKNIPTTVAENSAVNKLCKQWIKLNHPMNKFLL